MVSFLKKRWFLIGLAVLIAGGMSLGANVPEETVDHLIDGELKRALAFFPRATTAIVLFLMSFSLDSSRLKASFRSPRPVLWASVVNFAGIPLLAWALMPLQLSLDFSVGLMIAASVPCTMAAASVWTRKAGGNDAVSLMVTLATNAVCFAVTPFWLNLTVQLTGDADIRLDLIDMMIRLLVVVLVPTILGQLLRQFPKPGRIAVDNKTAIGTVAQSFILVIVFYAACKAGNRLAGPGPNPGLLAISVVWVTVICVHLLAMYLGVRGARLFGFDRADRAAVAFASSQKTLPIGVLLATDPTMFGDPNLLGPGVGLPFAVFPMLMFHASQLFIDTAVADRMAAADAAEK